MQLIVGLGNPGDSYRLNRHNVGFIVIDSLAAELGMKYKKKKHYDYFNYDGAIFVKPRTFMNNSGNAVTSVLTSNRIDDLLVIVDDIYLPVGQIRIRNSGGYGGHNGLKSIGDALGSNQFKRIRIGVGTPGNKELRDYVLSNINPEERDIFEFCFSFGKELVMVYLKNGFTEVLNYYSKNKNSYSEKIDNLRIAGDS